MQQARLRLWDGRRLKSFESHIDVLDFINRYQKMLNTRIDSLSEGITYGNVKNWEEYKARVGEIQGVAYALDELKALLKKVNYVEDTDRT